MRVTVVRGPSPAGPFELREGENVAGRAPECEVCLPSKRVSRRHAVFFVQDGRVEVRDLGSHNGILAGNGKRVATLALEGGGRVQIGDYLLALEVDDELLLEEDDLLLDEDTAEAAAAARSAVPAVPPPILPFAPRPTGDGAAAPKDGGSPPVAAPSGRPARLPAPTPPASAAGPATPGAPGAPAPGPAAGAGRPVPPPPELPFAPTGFGGAAPRPAGGSAGPTRSPAGPAAPRPVADPSRSVLYEPEELLFDDGSADGTDSVVSEATVSSLGGPPARGAAAPAAHGSGPPPFGTPGSGPPPFGTPGSGPPPFGTPGSGPPPFGTSGASLPAVPTADAPAGFGAAPLPFGPPAGGFTAPPPSPKAPEPPPRAPPSPKALPAVSTAVPTVSVPGPRSAQAAEPRAAARGGGVSWLVQAALLALAIVGLVLCAPFGGVAALVRAQGAAVEEMSLLRGVALAEALANRNALPLAEQRGWSLETSFLLERDGVRAALVADKSGTVLAPAEKLRTSVAAVPAFAEAARTGEVVRTELGDGLWQLVHPIRVQVGGAGPRQIVGYALVEYDPSAAGAAVASPVLGAVAGLFVAGAVVALLVFGAWRLVLRPLVALREETELALLGDEHEVVSPVRLPQMDELAHSINRAVARARAAGAPRR